MAIIKCMECNKEYSDTLVACPHCGFVRQQNTAVDEKPSLECTVLDNGNSELAPGKDRISAQKAA